MTLWLPLIGRKQRSLIFISLLFCSVPPLNPDLCRHFTCSANEFPDDFVCSVEEVEHLLASVDPSKVSGADLLFS